MATETCCRGPRPDPCPAPPRTSERARAFRC